MRLGGDRPERHRAGGEAFDDFLGRLDFVKRQRRPGSLELEQPAQRHVPPRLIVDQRGIFLVGLVLSCACRVLQFGDRIGRPHVLFATHAVSVLAAGVEHGGQHGVVAESLLVQANRFFHHLEDTDAFHLRRSSAEVLVDHLLLKTDRLEDLCSGVRHVSRNAHLRHHLEQAFADTLDEVLDRLLALFGVPASQLPECFERQVRVHGFGAVTGKQGEMMRFTRGTGFDNQPDTRAQTLGDQMVVHGGGGQQGRNRDMLGIDPSIRDDQDARPLVDVVLGFRTQRSQTGFNAFIAPRQRVTDVEFGGVELVAGVGRNTPQLRHVVEIEYRLGDFETIGRIDFVDPEQIGFGTDE